MLPSSPNPEGQAANRGIRKLAVSLTNVADLRLIVLLTPVHPGKTAPTPKTLPLAEW